MAIMKAMAVQVIAGRYQRARPTAAPTAASTSSQVMPWCVPSPLISSVKNKCSRAEGSRSQPMSFKNARRATNGTVQNADSAPPMMPMTSACQDRRHSPTTSATTAATGTASRASGDSVTFQIAAHSMIAAMDAPTAPTRPMRSGSACKLRTATIAMLAATAKASGMGWHRATNASTRLARARPVPRSSERQSKPRYTSVADSAIENANSPASVEAALPP